MNVPTQTPLTPLSHNNSIGMTPSTLNIYDQAKENFRISIDYNKFVSLFFDSKSKIDN